MIEPVPASRHAISISRIAVLHPRRRLIVAFPIYYVFVASTHSLQTILRPPLPLLPGDQFIENYSEALFGGVGRIGGVGVGTLLLNTTIVALGIAVGKIFISILSAYAIVFFRFPLRMVFFWMIFITLMLPVEVRILPTYKVMVDLGLIDTYAGLIVPLIASATATLLFRQFFMTIPGELVEAARIDGAGPWRFFKDILLPLSRTNIAALFVILFIYGWTQYLWPLLVTNRNAMNTIVIALRKMISFADADTAMASGHGHLHAGHPAADPGRGADAALVRQGPGRDARSESDGDGRSEGRAGRSMPAASRPSRAFHSPFPTRSSACWSARRAAASPRCCAWSPGWRHHRRHDRHRRPGRQQLEPAERDIAMVFQNYALYPHMNVSTTWPMGCGTAASPRTRSTERVRQGGEDAGAWRLSSTASRASCRAASASASPWAAPWCAIRRSSCSTSRFPTSTPNCAARCGSRSRLCSARSVSPRSWAEFNALIDQCMSRYDVPKAGKRMAAE